MQAMTQSERNGYPPMFTRQEITELVNLYHLARTALADKPYVQQSPYHRMLWATSAFANEHPDLNRGRIYKELERALS